MLTTMIISWFLRLAQFFLDLVYRPPRETNQVVCYDVLYHNKAMQFGSNDPAHFLRKFTVSRDVEWIKQEDVHLFCVTKKSFVFARTTPGVDIHNISDHPFLYNAKSSHAVELGVISVELALDLVRDRADDGSNIGYLHNLGRCGSTLVCNMVFRTGQCQVLSEPGALLDLTVEAVQNPKLMDDPKTVERLRAILLFLAKDPERKYFIKIHSLLMHILPLIHKALPGVRETFMYRSLKPMFISAKRAFNLTMPYSIFKRFTVSAGFCSKEMVAAREREGADGIDKFLMYTYLQDTRTYLDEAVTRSDLVAYSYESLIADPEGFVAHFLGHIGVGSEWTDLAVTAMNEDSQKNSWLSKKDVDGRVKKMEVILEKDTEEFVKKLAEEKFRIELVGDKLEMYNITNQWNSD